MALLETVNTVLATQVAGNLLSAWLTGLVVATVAYQILRFTRSFLSRQLNRAYGPVSDENWGITRFLGVIIGSTGNWFLLALCVYSGFQFVELPAKQAHFVDALPSLAFFLQLAFWVKKGVEYKLGQIISIKKDLRDRQQFSTVATPVKFVILFLLWSLILLAALDNLGVNITALIAGLGIGGVAVALAVQSTLGDLLGALTIAFDKPFIVGDFIVTGTSMGTIEKIGLKTTRVRSLGGEELIFPNQDLLSSRIQNFKRMKERRIVFGFGVLYQTSASQLRRIPEIVKDIILGLDNCRFDRAHFYKFGDSSYDFEVVYYVLSPEYNDYMDCQQIINLALVERLEAESVSFAYPTRTVYFQSEEDPQKVSAFASSQN
ncbi:mechanosensitive ion channel family protein [Vampirovibrio sp.]|uniref:mechanosensitive ion channel family protein n=1 Tax=Vampirovibrio sp. TaxID=2717857 RepID=UPI0035931FE8